MSSPRFERMFGIELDHLLHSMERVPERLRAHPDSMEYIDYEEQWHREWIRWAQFHDRFFMRPWTACIVPSGNDDRLDHELCARGLLRALVDDHPEHRGLILQPSEPPRNHFSLLDAIPALRHATNNVSRWPLLLVWSNSEAALLPIGRNSNNVLSRMRVAMRMLYDGVPLSVLEEEYSSKVEPEEDRERDPVHLIHMSDVHIGSKEAKSRTRHLAHLVRTLRAELGVRTVPIISGDLFDTPDPKERGNVMNFVDEVSRAVGEKPFCVAGNHDLRHAGWAGSRPGAMMEAHLDEPIRAYENYGISLVGFNSCEGGNLGRGEITESQLHEQNQRIDDQAVGMRIGIVHHHPVAVERPDWEFRPFWERWLDPLHAPTVEMVNGKELLHFCAAKNVQTVLHGHKHIPRFVKNDDVRIVGCGSSVGIIKTKDRAPYISVNVLTVFPDSGRVITRLLADRTHGGLEEQTRHEFIALS